MTRTKKPTTPRTCSPAEPKYAPAPLTGSQPPLVRLVRTGEGIVGWPWMDVLAVLPERGAGYGAKYWCRLPGTDTHPELELRWFLDRELFGDGMIPPEYTAQA